MPKLNSIRSAVSIEYRLLTVKRTDGQTQAHGQCRVYLASRGKNQRPMGDKLTAMPNLRPITNNSEHSFFCSNNGPFATRNKHIGPGFFFLHRAKDELPPFHPLSCSPLPLLSPPFRIRPLNTARESGECCKSQPTNDLYILESKMQFWWQQFLLIFLRTNVIFCTKTSLISYGVTVCIVDCQWQ